MSKSDGSQARAARQRPNTFTAKAKASLWRIFAAIVPYSLGMVLISFFLRQNWVIRTVFRERLSLFSRVAPLVGSTEDPLNMVRRSVQCSIFRVWGFRQFGQWDIPELEEWMRVDGLDLVTRHYKEHPEQGLVLVNSHYGASRVISFYLQLLGYKVTSLESHGLLAALKVRGAENIDILELGFGTKFFLKHVYQARKALLEGRIFHLAADGYQGTSGSECRFHGRLRQFARGFPELAIKTESPVYLVFASMDEHGKIQINISGPLDYGTTEVEVSQRVDNLIDCYIDALEGQWTSNLGCVHVSHLKRYLDLPKANAAA